jgi:1-acyl-sn-glycerol-3-phosphate acyltransferase
MIGGKQAQAALLAVLRQVFRIEVVGSVPEMGGDAYVLAANHVSHLDALAVLAALPRDARGRVVVAAAEDYFFTRPALAWLARSFANAIPLRRHGHPVSGVRHALARLAAGSSVLIFPQGTRSAAWTRFKPGVALVAARSGAPIVPVGITGTGRILPKGARWPRPGSIRVVFGRPLVVPADAEPGEIAREVERQVAALAGQPADLRRTSSPCCISNGRTTTAMSFSPKP